MVRFFKDEIKLTILIIKNNFKEEVIEKNDNLLIINLTNDHLLFLSHIETSVYQYPR